MRRPHTAASGKRNRTRLLKKGPGRRMFARRRQVPPRLPVSNPESVAQRLAAAMQPAAKSAGAGAGVCVGMEAPASRAEESSAAESTRCGFGAVRVGPLLGRLRLHLQTERFLAVHRGDAAWEEACAAAGLALAAIAEEMTEAALDAPLPPLRQPPTPAGGRPCAVVTPMSEPGEGCTAVCSAGLQPGTRLVDPSSTALKGSATQGGAEPSSPIKNRTADSSSLQKAHPFLGMTPSSGADVVVVGAASPVGRGARKTGTAALAACGAALERLDAHSGCAPGTAIGRAIAAGVITSPPQGKTSVFAVEKKADAGSAVAKTQMHNGTADRPRAHQHPGSSTRAAQARSATPQGSPRVGVEARGAR